MRSQPLVSCVSLKKHFGLTGAQQAYPDGYGGLKPLADA